MKHEECRILPQMNTDEEKKQNEKSNAERAENTEEKKIKNRETRNAKPLLFIFVPLLLKTKEVMKDK